MKQNILVDGNGNALLCDFGLSRFYDGVMHNHSVIHRGGCARYLAPELISDQEDDVFRTTAATDCYALAMTYHELGTGSRPLDQYKSDYSLWTAVRKGVLPKRPFIIPGLLYADTSLLWSIMQRMWSGPDKRPAVRDVLEQLRAFESRKIDVCEQCYARDIVCPGCLRICHCINNPCRWDNAS